VDLGSPDPRDYWVVMKLDFMVSLDLLGQMDVLKPLQCQDLQDLDIQEQLVSLVVSDFQELLVNQV